MQCANSVIVDTQLIEEGYFKVSIFVFSHSHDRSVVSISFLVWRAPYYYRLFSMYCSHGTMKFLRGKFIKKMKIKFRLKRRISSLSLSLSLLDGRRFFSRPCKKNSPPKSGNSAPVRKKNRKTWPFSLRAALHGDSCVRIVVAEQTLGTRRLHICAWRSISFWRR